jgi:hypothetical protein
MHRRLKVCALAGLSVLAGFYVIRAGAQLVTFNGYDLHLRWVEEQYVLRGRDPFQVVKRYHQENQGRGIPDLRSHEWHLGAPVLFRPDRIRDEVEPDLEAPFWPNYPPWAYFTGLLFVFPPWPITPWWFLLVNLASLIFLSRWIWRELRDQPTENRLIVIVAAWAFGSVASTLRLGQYGLVVVAAIAAAHWAMQQRRSVLAGIFFAIAMTKPTIAAPFLLIPLVLCDWKTIAVTAAYLVVASVAVWAYVGTDPISMLIHMLGMPPNPYGAGGVNVIRWLTDWGIDTRAALLLCALAGIAAAVTLMVQFRRSSLAVLFAIAAFVSRFWTHHDLYDDLILLFLVVPLAQATLDRTRGAWILLALLGVSMLMPSSVGNTDARIHIFQALIWAVALVTLLQVTRHGKAREENEQILRPVPN